MTVIVFVNCQKEKSVIVSQKIREICEESNCKAIISANDAQAFELCPQGCAFGVVLGGDGTMLNAAKWASATDTPLIGINLGRLGYMNELEENEIDLLKQLFSVDFSTEERMMLETAVTREGKQVFSATSLNEIVVCRGVTARLIDLDLMCNGKKAGFYRADGIIISTPTGSTAYSMSAGGPIVDPSLKLISVSAVCPHGYSGTNTVVFSPDSVIEVKVSSEYNGDIYVTADGRSAFELYRNDIVTVRRSKMVTRLIKLKGNAFYSILARKFQ